MKKRSCVVVSLTLLTPALLAGCSQPCDPKVDPDCKSNGRGGYSRPFFGGYRSYSGGGSRTGTGISGTSGRGGFGAFGGGGRAGG